MKRDHLAVPDSLTFRKMWRDGATLEAIASEFQVSITAVGYARKRYEYPDRLRGALLGPMPTTPAHVDPDRDAPAALPPTGGFGRWTVSQIAAMQRSNGRYRALAELAEEWGESVKALIALWHRVRVGS